MSSEANGDVIGDSDAADMGGVEEKNFKEGMINGGKAVNNKRKKGDLPKSVKKKKKKSSEETPELVPVIDMDSLENMSPEDEPGSLETADEAFEWMIAPTPVKTFYAEYWEKKPLHVKRTDIDQGYYKTVFSTKSFEKMLRDNHILYGKNVDVTSFDKDKRETHNPAGRVVPAVMWDFYNNGCSIRMLNPQTYHNAVWRLCSTLQDHFHSMVGANVYLTPPGTQGFAPHWDDVEVFMLQLEGRKHWKLYGPRTPSEKLPRFSSENFSQEDFPKPMMELELGPGDLLYLPRGTVHQGNCLESEHSLHITISTYQLNSWTDLLEKLLPAALAEASQEDVEFREGLPRDYLQTMGIAREGEKSEGRTKFMDKITKLMGKLMKHAPVDAACDQLGKRLMGDVLPPALEVGEKARTVLGDGEKWHSAKKTVVNRVEIDPDTNIRLVRATACRLVQEEDTVKVFYSTENTKLFREVDVEDQFLEVGEDLAPAVEHLITSYPAWVKVEELPVDELEDRMKVAGDLWEKGIIITSDPLESHYDDP
jgi:lysine-specific demethylase/histidyl-hydroxylase NO66